MTCDVIFRTSIVGLCRTGPWPCVLHTKALPGVVRRLHYWVDRHRVGALVRRRLTHGLGAMRTLDTVGPIGKSPIPHNSKTVRWNQAAGPCACERER